MNIKIISDGHSSNTKVVNVETGEVVEGIQEINWHCFMDHLATVELKIADVPVDINFRE